MNDVQPLPPRIGIIGGSGLGNALLASEQFESCDIDTPFGKPSAPIMLANWHGIPIAFLARHGIGHTIPPSAIPFRANIYALKSAGCRWIIASGAVGSLQEAIAPRDLVLIDQTIDKTTRRVGTFFDAPGGGAVHVELADPICPDLHGILASAASTIDWTAGGAPGRVITVHKTGTYVCMEGPAFSTRAESLLNRRSLHHPGGDVIGMTAVPEAKLAREAEISYALVALATDYDCWKPHKLSPGETKQTLLAEIMGHMSAATENALALIKAAVPKVWARREETFAAHRALELAIWTDKSRIPEEVKNRLALLWGKYFS